MAKTKPMQAGDLDRQIDILQLDTMRNTVGEIGKSLSPFLPGVWAKKEDIGGTEKDDPTTGRVTAFGRVDFTIRYRADLKETMAVDCEGIRYDILNVREGEGRKQWTVIEAQKHD